MGKLKPRFMEKFDYNDAISELENLARTMEDPSKGLEEVEKCLKRSDELIVKCRTYLRSAREKIENL